MISSHLSSEETPEGERLTAWRDFLGRKFLRTNIDPLPDRRFFIDATLHRLAGMNVVWSFSSGAWSRRTSDLIDGEDQVVLNIVREGACVVSQRGVEVTCQAGEAILMSTTETATVLRPTDTRVLTVSLPRLALAPFMADSQAAIMQRIPSSAMLRLLTHYLDSMPTALLQDDPALEQIFVRHVHELVARAASVTALSEATVPGNGLRAARLRAAQRYIEGNLHEPGLTPAGIATALGISVRQLHQLFEEGQGTSVMRHVLARRLGHAALLLTGAAGQHDSIAEIAFQSGFDSLATFYRAFKKAYGLSPADYRAGNAGQ